MTGKPDHGGKMTSKPGYGGKMTGKPGHGGKMTGKPGYGGNMTGKPGYGGKMTGKPGHGGKMTGKPGHGGKPGHSGKPTGKAGVRGKTSAKLSLTKRTWSADGSNTECDAGAGEVYRSQSSGLAKEIDACKKSCEDDSECKSITFFTSGWCSHFSTDCTKRKFNTEAISMRSPGSKRFLRRS